MLPELKLLTVMSRQTIIVCISFCVLVSNIFASRYTVIQLPQRIDEEGFKWIGPLRLAPLGSIDAEINGFIADNLALLKPRIAKGFPEFGFPAMDPFILKKFDYEQTIGPVKIKIAQKNIQIKGLSKYERLKLSLDSKRKRIHFFFDAQKIDITAIYKAFGNAILYPIRGSGPLHLKIDNLRISGYMNVKNVTREDGLEIAQVYKTSIERLKFEKINATVKGLFPGNPELSETFHFSVNNHGPEIYHELLEDELSPRFAAVITDSIANPLIYNIPYYIFSSSND